MPLEIHVCESPVFREPQQENPFCIRAWEAKKPYSLNPSPKL